MIPRVKEASHMRIRWKLGESATECLSLAGARVLWNSKISRIQKKIQKFTMMAAIEPFHLVFLQNLGLEVYAIRVHERAGCIGPWHGTGTNRNVSDARSSNSTANKMTGGTGDSYSVSGRRGFKRCAFPESLFRIRQGKQQRNATKPEVGLCVGGCWCWRAWRFISKRRANENRLKINWAPSTQR